MLLLKVKVEKYYTPEQQKIIEKKKKEDEEKRARERGENARERALNDMMGGVLEIKKEDELKKVCLNTMLNLTTHSDIRGLVCV